MNTLNPLTAQIDIGGIWHIGMFFGLVMLTLYGVRQTHLPIITQILWLYAMGYALFLLEYPYLQFADYHTAFQATAGQALAEMLIVPLFALSLRRFYRLWFALMSLVISSLFCVWFHWEGLLIAPSFHTAYLALCLPFLPFWLGVLTVFTIITHHGSTALLILMAQAIGWMGLKRRYKQGIAILLVAILVLVLSPHQMPYFDGLERLQKYQDYLTLWAADWRSILFGAGPGSFMWLSLLHDGFRGPLFLQMHSDWLQILFELGVIGIILTGGTVIAALKITRSQPQLFCAILGACAFGLTYHPLRFFPTAFTIACIFGQAFSYRKD